MAEKKSSGFGRFKKFVTDKKYRPWLIGGVIVIGAVILLSLIRPRSSAGAGASPVPAGQPVAGGISEQGQLAMAQIQAGLTGQQYQAQAAIDVASIGAALEQARIVNEANIAQTQSSNALEIARLQTMFQIAATERQLDSQTQIELAKVEAAKFQAAQEAEIAFGQQGVSSLGILAGRDVSLAQINAEENVALYSIGTRHNEMMYGLQKAKRKHVGAILAGESPELGTKTKSILGGIALRIGGIFSDLRIKDDVQWSGVTDGVNRYEYFNQKTGMIEAGVMAQDVDEHYRVPMGGMFGNVMGVDYAAFNADAERANG